MLVLYDTLNSESHILYLKYSIHVIHIIFTLSELHFIQNFETVKQPFDWNTYS